MPQLPVKDFSKSKPLIESLDLNETQIKSYKWFVEKGLRELFDEISPITDHTGNELALHFEEYRFDEPKHDELTARYKDISFETPLRVNLRLENKTDGTSKTQEVYFGDFPTMTDRGTFIINGVERVVISQLVRSPGAYFIATAHRGRKFFGAKVIPNRGAWLEFETDLDGSIGVKIDRHRKVPVTDLLRVFGLTTNEKILEAFREYDKGTVRYIEATLAKDDAEDVDASYVEIYRHLRPGDPATPATAKSLIDAMFLRGDRYDLSLVGRYKTNQRLGLKKEDRLLSIDDLVGIVRQIIALNNNPESEPDDIDHLGNRRVKAVGELIEGRLRIAFARLRRIVQDRMSTVERENLMPGQLVSFRPITAILNDFFASSQLSQFMDQVNPLAELEHKRRISALGPGGLTRERASFEVRDVHRSHYGRICPIQTPEGANIGLINYLANYARVDDFGFIETPYAKVKDSKVTKEIVWLNALAEEKYRITHAGVKRDEHGNILAESVEARIFGEPGTCLASEVDLIDVAPHQFVSVSTSLIPFLQHDDANRALMGSNMQRQAVVTIRPEVPYVGTGQEESAARDSAYIVLAEDDGKVLEVDATHIVLKYKKETKTHLLEKFKRSNQFTAISQRPVVTTGQSVKKGDVLADGPAIDHGVLGLGKNLLVAFMSWEGANFEDAVILSERVRRDDFFTSIHIEDFECDVRDTKLGPEMTTPDIPNVSEEKLRNLDEEGIVRIGAEVKAGDILVGKISPKGESELSSEERLLRAIFGEKARDVKDASLVLSHGKRGRVVNVKIFEREKGDKLEPGIIKRIQVEIAVLRKIQAGDKMAGRHGNKGVISQVRPVEDMPYLADGTPVDVILNPLGVASRMNLGQILETHLGLAAKILGYRAVTPSLDSATEEDIRHELKKAGLPEDSKVTLYDGRTGRSFDGKVMVGIIYMMKLNHLVEDKAHARSIGPYSLITQQPLGGKAQFGGQRFGEMEVWALEGYGAKYTLQEMLTLKSDDVLGRASAYESIIRGEPIKEPNIPAAFNVLISELKSLGLNIEPVYDSETARREDFSGLKIELASPEEIMKWSHGEVTKPETINYRTQRPEKDGLFSERIFGPTRDFECYCGKYRKVRYKGVICDKCGVEVTHSSVRRERMAHIALATPVAHIWFVKSVPSRLGMILNISSQKLEQVIYYAAYIVTQVDEVAKKRALDDLQKELKSKGKMAVDKVAKSELQASAAGVKDTLDELQVGKTLSEPEYFSLSRKFGDVFHAATGAEAVRKILEKLDLKKEIHNLLKDLEHTKDVTTRTKDLRRLKMLKAMHINHIRPEWMITTTLPILPPDLRPMVALDGGRYATSDLNDLYRRVINRNNRLKKLLEIKAPDIIIRNEKRMLQEAVDALIDNSARFGTQQLSAQRRPLRSLADMLKGKQGRFRQNLLGKRVDYSGRSVIVVGPKLNLNQCGLPKRMALELFRPFVVSEIIRRGLAHNIRSAGRLIEQGADEVWEILEEVIQNRRVLLNRAPTLHRLSIQAFNPILTEGLAIQLPPLVTTAFNADFDGDQMAVHLPLSHDAQREARELMASERNLLKPATGDLIALPTQDAILGTYYLTCDLPELYVGRAWAFSSREETLMALEMDAITLHTPIMIDKMITTAGRIIFNDALDGKVPYVNEPVNKKKLGKIMDEIVVHHGVEVTHPILDRVKLLGFEMATRSGITWSVGDMVVPPGKKMIMEAAETEVAQIKEYYGEGLLTDIERRTRIISVWEKAKDEIAKLVAHVLPKGNPIYQIIDSGSRGSWAQPVQMMGIKGVVVNPKNEKIELPIKASYKEGLSVLEYFISTHGARKGTTDTALKTSQAGYLTRRLVDVSQGIVIREDDCGVKEGMELRRSDAKEFQQSFAGRIFSRVALEGIKDGRKVLVKSGETITKAMARVIDESDLDAIMVRSPINCKTLYGICSKCYGYDLGRNWDARIGDAVGVVAAQSIGEPGTQLTLRTFHTGGVAGVDITHGLPRIEELFEARPPKGQAILVHEEGIVSDISESGTMKIVSVKFGPKKADVKEYSLPRSVMLLVKTGEKMKRGDQLFEGNLNLHELLSLKGPEAVHKYIINEVQKIYLSEGTLINDKHIEVIVRQMFSRVRVKDAGDAPDFVMGEVLEKSKFLEVNRTLRRDKKTPAKAEQLLLGITRVALTTESVLSAASFQDTARVLVRAALEGKIDRLMGLKENVIIGRLVPLGEGIEKSNSTLNDIPEAEAATTAAEKGV